MFGRKRKLDDFSAEIEAHLQLEIERLKEQGLSEEVARAAARRTFGNVTRAQERYYESGRWLWWDHFWQDVRYGLRMLGRSPGFTTVAVLTLALGIGANTAIFSIVNGVLLNPLPYPQPDQLVMVYDKPASSHEEIWESYPNFQDYQRDNHIFLSMAADSGDDFNLTGAGETERLSGDRISAGFFSLLGVKPVIGRMFDAEEDQPGAQPVALIGAGFWKRKFGSSPDVIGKAITLNGTQYTIVGVISASFHFDRSRDVYIPLGQWSEPAFHDRNSHMIEVEGRLKPGVTVAQAQADMDEIGRNLAAAYPESDRDKEIAVVPLKKDIVGDIQPYLLVLLGAVGFVLLISCANVANLLLARSTGRAQEFAVRAALGAGQRRIIRQLLTESTLLAVAGGGAGLIGATWGTQAALSFLPEALPRAEEIGLDARVLIFTVTISLLTGVLFGLAPALKTTRPNLQDTLKEAGRGSSGARHRAQEIFVAAQLALSLVLLIGAGLMIRSLARLWTVSPGFNPHNVLTFNLSLPAAASRSPDGLRTYFRQLHEKLDTIPGVEASSLFAGSLPMMGDAAWPFWLEGEPKPVSDNDMKLAMWYSVEPEYFKAMHIPLERGRLLTSKDDEHAPFIIMVDEIFANKYFGNQDPIGKRINFSASLPLPQAQIVGVVGHVKHWGLDAGNRETIPAQFYFPLLQTPGKLLSWISTNITVVMRTQGAPLGLVGSIHQTMKQMNGGQVIYDEKTMDEVVSKSLASRRFSMILLDVFASLALVLSCVGIYGVVSYLIGQRTHEIGIRIVLGAQRRDVLRLVVGEGVKMALIGVAVGVAAAFGLTRLMANMLFGVSATDALTFGSVAILLTIVALAACYIPAHRAMRVDPMVALRYE
jgi:predicted permease